MNAIAFYTLMCSIVLEDGGVWDTMSLRQACNDPYAYVQAVEYAKLVEECGEPVDEIPGYYGKCKGEPRTTYYTFICGDYPVIHPIQNCSSNAAYYER